MRAADLFAKEATRPTSAVSSGYPPDGLRLAQAIAGRREAGPETQRRARSSPQGDQRRPGQCGAGPGEGSEGQWLSYGPVDARPGRRGHREDHPGEIPRRTRLEGAPPDGLEPTTATRQAAERNDEAIEQWVNERWPRAKRARNAWIVFQDESGFSLLPSVRSTWPPKGQTPVLTHYFNWKRLSMSARTVLPTGRQRRLRRLRHASGFPQRRIDHGVPHRAPPPSGRRQGHPYPGRASFPSQPGHAGLPQEATRRWLVVERLPGYATDLNPVEQVWGNLKDGSWPTCASTPSARPRRSSTRSSA